MNTEMKLRKHQLDFAARVIYTGTGLAAHEVGAGKTAALIAAGMYLKNLGAIHKAVFVVPNPLVGQWAIIVSCALITYLTDLLPFSLMYSCRSRTVEDCILRQSSKIS